MDVLIPLDIVETLKDLTAPVRRVRGRLVKFKGNVATIMIPPTSTYSFIPRTYDPNEMVVYWGDQKLTGISNTGIITCSPDIDDPDPPRAA